MNIKNTNKLFECYNENFEKFFGVYYIKIRERANLIALQNRVEPENEEKSIFEMRGIYYSDFFKDIVHWCKSLTICADDPTKTTEHYLEVDVQSFFESEVIKSREDEVEQIIFNCFTNYTDLAFKLTAPLWGMIGTQDNLIRSFIKSIDEKNDDVLKKIKREDAGVFIKYYSLIGKKLSEIGKEELIRISKYIKYKAIETRKEFNQTFYENEILSIFNSAKRGNVRFQIEKKFSPKKYQQWLDELSV